MIQNTTRKTVIAKEKKLAKSPLSKARGLMLAKPLKDKGLVMVFGKEKKISLHMLFVLFPIDVLWLDRSKKVVELKEGFKPFTFCTPRMRAYYIIELPAGAINQSGTEVGDRVEF